ncbi:MAG: tRNA 2-thiouridine(34) synthase MnmA [Clostridia bacterium]|nr:tRNA 2-thiouridine(34) synthase MnmA [Clostridia bacterium]
MQKVIVGLSGGVDSAVAAYLLKSKGYDVVGVILRTWEADGEDESRCCAIDDARAVARCLGIPFYAFNCTASFQTYVVQPFIEEYLQGRTPNPCIECNRYVKWERILYYSKMLQADFLATGHYASVRHLENGRFTLQKAAQVQRDQTYMLYQLTQEQLCATLMPLGGLTKEEVRRIALKAGLPVAEKPDSQEICFVTEGNYADFIRCHAASPLPEPGNFVDESGNILGQHKGIVSYTVGQRKGLGLALGYPAYVTEIRAPQSEVVLGEEKALYRSELLCSDLNFMSIPSPNPGETLRCQVKVRYHHTPQSATIEMLSRDSLLIHFDQPVKAPTPGQSAVFYDEEDCVVGGGKIRMAK